MTVPRSRPPILAILLVLAVAGLVGFAVWKRVEESRDKTKILANLDPNLIRRRANLNGGRPTPTPTPVPTVATEPDTPVVARTTKSEDKATSEPIEIALSKPPGSLRGWVQTPLGEYLGDATVRLEFEDLKKDGLKAPNLTATSTALGVFDFPKVPPGAWSVVAEHPDYAPGVRKGVRVKSSEVTEGIAVAVVATSVVSGSVKSSAGLLIDGAELRLSRRLVSVDPAKDEVVRNDFEYAKTKTNAKGEFTFEKAAIGAGVLDVTYEGYASERREFTLVRDQKLTLAIELEAAAAVGGVVRTTSGRLIPDVTVELTDAAVKDWKATGKSTAQGQFLVSGLRAERTYRLSAKRENFAPAGPIEVASGTMQNIIVLDAGGALTGKVRDYNTKNAVEGLGVIIESTGTTYPLVRRTASQSDGHYGFGLLPAGTYDVRVDSERLTSEPRLAVAVKLGEETKNIDLNVYAGLRIDGIVIDATSTDRIAGATVDLASKAGPGLLKGAQTKATTNDIGEFAFENLPFGLYSLAATATGYVVPLPADSEARAEVRLLPNASVDPVVLALSEGGSLSGTVVDGTGVGLDNAIVQLGGPGIPSGGDGRLEAKNWRQTTVAGGAFAFEGIPLERPLDIVVLADAEGFAPGRSPSLRLSKAAPADSTQVVLGIGGIVEVRVRGDGKALGGAPVSLGHNDFGGAIAPPTWKARTNLDGSWVFDNVPAGNVTVTAEPPGYRRESKSGRLADGGRLSLEIETTKGVRLIGWVRDDHDGEVTKGGVNMWGEAGARGSASVQIEPTGRFVADGLDPGTLTLDVFAVRDTPTGEHRIAKRHRGVPSNEGEQHFTVAMNGRIQGQVLDGLTMDPVPGANVSIAGEYEHFGAGGTFRSNKTCNDPPGEFDFQSLPPGTYSLSVRAGGYLPFDMKDVKVDSPGITDLSRVLIEKGGAVALRVIDAKTDAPVVGAKVVVVAEDKETQVGSGKTDASGTAKITGVPGGIYDLRVSHGAYLPAIKELVQVREGTDTDAGTLKLDKGGVLTIMTTDGLGAPLAGAVVSVRDVDDDTVRTGRTNNDGEARFEGLEAGGVLLSATANFKRGPFTQTGRAAVSLFEEQTITLQLAGNLTLEGLLRGPGGAIVSGPRVVVYPLEADDRPVLRGGMTAEVGANSYRLAEIPEGRYLILAQGKINGVSAAWHRAVFVSPPGTKAPVIAPASGFFGRVSLPNGAPAAKVRVRLKALSFPQSGISSLASWWQYSVVSDAGGGWTIDYLAPGTYEVVVSVSGYAEYRDIVDLDAPGAIRRLDVKLEPK